jgi:hypothetical protein
MAAYADGKAVGLNPGDMVTLSDASLTGLKTIAIAYGPSADLSSDLVVIANESAVALTVQYARKDVEASYQAYKYAGTAITVAANSANSFPVSNGFYRVLCASDPGATVITIAR